MTLAEIAHALAALRATSASHRQFVASVSSLIFQVGPCYDWPQDEQAQAIEMIVAALRAFRLSQNA